MTLIVPYVTLQNLTCKKQQILQKKK